MYNKHPYKYNLDELIHRFNECSRNKIEKVHRFGYEEEFNERDIYNPLINLDIKTGFIKMKSFLKHIQEIPGADVVIEIKRIDSGRKKIAFKGIASSYSEWIKDLKNLRYLTLFGYEGFYTHGNIRIVRWNYYNSFCFIDSFQQAKLISKNPIEYLKQSSGRNSINNSRTSINNSRTSINNSRTSINNSIQDPNKSFIETLRRSLNENITPESSDTGPLDL